MRLLLVLSTVLALVAASAAEAALSERTPGSRALGLREGHGIAKVRGGGSFRGNIARGQIVATNNVKVIGWTERTELSATLSRYRGSGRMAYSVASYSGPWRLRFRGSGINGAGFVRGCLTLDAVNAGPTGRYAIGRKASTEPRTWPRWPRALTKFPLGSGHC